MELRKKNVHCSQIGKRMIHQFFVDDDYNVPMQKRCTPCCTGGGACQGRRDRTDGKLSQSNPENYIFRCCM